MNSPTASFLPLLASAALLLNAVPADAADLISSSFTSVGLTSPQDIDVTGPDVVDWGYYTVRASFFTTPAVDNSKAASGIGAVTIAPGAVSDATFNWSSSLPKFTMTVDDGGSPAAGTVGIGAGLGGWAATEDNAATFTFNDLGVGTHTVRVFAGHSSNDRIFDMNYSVTATDGNLSGNTVSNSIGSGDLHSTYQIVFSTTDPSADLVLQLNSTSGGTGSGWIGGYIVETAGSALSAPRVTSTEKVGGAPGALELELTLEGPADSSYVFRSSTTLDFNPGTLVENLSQGDPADPGTVGGANNTVLTLDEKGLGRVRMTLTGQPRDFVRAETAPPPPP